MSGIDDLLKGLGDKINQQDAEQLSEAEAADLFQQGLQIYEQAKNGTLPLGSNSSVLFTPLQYWLM